MKDDLNTSNYVFNYSKWIENRFIVDKAIYPMSPFILELEKYLSNTLKMKGFLLSDLLALSCKIDTDKKFTETLLKVLRHG